MVAQSIAAPLRHLPLFEGLSAYQISEIARTAERVMFKPGQVIIQRDMPADAAYVIVAGDALRVDGPELGEQSARVEPGSLIGEMAMIVETESTSTIVARDHVKALRIPRAQFLDHLGDDPKLADHLMTRIVSRLHRLADELRAVDAILAEDTAATRH
jgi:CRP-like cAMP-binding protein